MQDKYTGGLLCRIPPGFRDVGAVSSQVHQRLKVANVVVCLDKVLAMNKLAWMFLVSLLGMSSLSAQCLLEADKIASLAPEAVSKFSQLAKRCTDELSAYEQSPTVEQHQPYLDYYDNGGKEIVFSVCDFQPEACLPESPGVAELISAPYRNEIELVSEKFNIDPLLLHSIIYVESRYNPSALSPAGAKGMMQVMPGTARRMGFQGSDAELYEPVTNLHIGSMYLRELYRLFGNEIDLVLAAYNAGEFAVKKYGDNIPPYPETQDYVSRVMSRYMMLSQR
jgi:lysozyme